MDELSFAKKIRQKAIYAADNYPPITCFPFLWTLFTGILPEEMYGYLEREGLLPDEQKGCRRGSRRTKNQLLIDKMVLRVVKGYILI